MAHERKQRLFVDNWIDRFTELNPWLFQRAMQEHNILGDEAPVDIERNPQLSHN